MPRSRPAVVRRAFILATLLAVCLPAPGWTWGSATHHYIAENYSKHLPPYIDGLRAYDAVVDQKVTDPDTRRPTTPGESYRHYIDIDNYAEFLAGTLSHDRATLEAQYGAATVLDNGIVPWAVGEVVATLTQQFQDQQWSAATTTGLPNLSLRRRRTSLCTARGTTTASSRATTASTRGTKLR